MHGALPRSRAPICSVERELSRLLSPIITSLGGCLVLSYHGSLSVSPVQVHSCPCLLQLIKMPIYAPHAMPHIVPRDQNIIIFRWMTETEKGRNLYPAVSLSAAELGPVAPPPPATKTGPSQPRTSLRAASAFEADEEKRRLHPCLVRAGLLSFGASLVCI